MIKKENELRREKIDSLRGGKGSVEFIHIMEKDQFNDNGRMFARLKLKPGNSIGYHKHEGDFEGYYFIKGEGTFNDNGKEYPVKAGDFTLTEAGQSHSLENSGDDDLEFIALILFAR